MFSNVKLWFLKPYPFPITTKSKFFISLGFGSFVFIFLILFKPFNFNILGEETMIFAMIYGLITFIVISNNLIFLPKFLPNTFDTNKWTIYKMTVFVILTMLVIGIINWYFSIYYSEIFNNKEFPLLFFIYKVFLVGIFPIIFYIFLSELIVSKKNIDVANTISQKKNSKILKQNNNKIELLGNNKNDKLVLEQDGLFYISSEKNYASIFHLEQNIIKETLLRVSLNNLENQLEEYSNIVRCHKSYIVNTKKVTQIKGNARSLLLIIPEIEITIPVSRNFPKELLFTLMK